MKIRVVAAVVDTEKLTLYKEDGTSVQIPQGDPRVARIITEASHALNLHQVVEVDITKDDDNAYQQFEKETAKSGGLVRLFRVAKSKVAAFFQAKAVPAMELGTLPGTNKEEETPEEYHAPAFQHPVKEQDDEQRTAAVGVVVSTLAAVAQAKAVEETAGDDAAQDAGDAQASPVLGTSGNAQLDSALSDIMKHATPVSDPTFNADKLGDNHDDTIVAVVDNGKGASTIVPHIEKLRPQLARAALGGSTEGMQKFLARIGAVIEQRSHSVEDLMKFMERGDLPVADDGSIIIYKVLKTKGDKSGTFYDVHTGNVPQKIGSYVHMDPSLVDPNRRNECSNGLHVARRGYIGGFSGDVCVLAKLAPEDVIAVPSYDANKMRVCGYHILFKLTESQHQSLKNNKPITDTVEGQKLLAKAMSGDHVGRLESVKIGGHNGTNITVTPLLGRKEASVSLKANDNGTDKMATALPDKGDDLAPVVDPKKVAETVQQPAQAADTAPATQTKAQQAQALREAMRLSETALEREDAARKLRDFKKASKKSWDALGLPLDMGDEIARVLGEDKSVVKTAPTNVKAAPAKADKSGQAVDKFPAAPKIQAPKAPKAPAAKPVVEEKGAAEKLELARKLLKEGKGNAEVATATGLSKDQVYRIKKKLG